LFVFQLYEHTKQAVAGAVQPVVAVACSVCGYGLQKINEVGHFLGRGLGDYPVQNIHLNVIFFKRDF